ncbi:LPXTG cell wall anchor domain-containing protein [Streptomyces sp. NPDC006334]|uniref:LPXTG cell wall anchor domain-containing protein n=1 Tax=Streptomyces sp. NPDC006334 TaxID=3156754 RepID=UPI0033BA39F4
MHSAIRVRGWFRMRAAIVAIGATVLVAGPLPGVRDSADAAPPKPMLGRCMDKYGTSATPPPTYKLPGYRPAGANQWKTPNAEDRFYGYDHLAKGFEALTDPGLIDLPDGNDPKKYAWGTPENAVTTWRQNQAGAKPYAGTFNEWLNNVYSRNEGNNKRGNAFESEVVKYFDLGGVDWICQKNLRDLNPNLYKDLERTLGKDVMKDGRVFDAVNQRTRTVYEIKSGIGYDARQLKIDAELVRRGWRVVYINGQEPDAKTIEKYRAAGVQHYRHAATPNPRFTVGKYTPNSNQLMTPDPNRPSFGSGGDMARRSAPTPEDARRQIERARGLIQQPGNSLRGPGGVDFSTLDISYIGQTKTGNLSYAFSAKNADEETAPGYGGEEKAQLISDAFFTWLALTPDHFWVNLNPDDPNTIMKAPFDKTDAGRILLEADMEMKRDFGRAEDPKTDAGKRFWDQITKVDGKPCMGSTRNWIVPKMAEVRIEDDGAYILSAPLEVKSVAQEYNTPGPGGGMPCTLTKEQTAHNMDVYGRTILPVVQKQVNEDAKYADLRRVYKARIAAEYVRQTVARDKKAFGGSFAGIIDRNQVKRWPLRGKNAAWDKMTVWKEMKRSFTEGDFKYEIPVGGEIWVYTVGGVDLTQQPQEKVSKARFQAEKPNLPSVTKGSRHEALDYQATGVTVMGGDNSGQAGGGKPGPGPSPGPTGTPTGKPTDQPTGSPAPSHTPAPAPSGNGGHTPLPTGGTGGGGTDGSLADTGTQVLTIAGLAAALLAAGAALVWIKRRRGARE